MLFAQMSSVSFGKIANYSKNNFKKNREKLRRAGYKKKFYTLEEGAKDYVCEYLEYKERLLLLKKKVVDVQGVLKCSKK